MSGKNQRADAQQRRQAVQIVSQLPEDAAEALQVLDLAKELVLTFYGGAEGRKPAELAIVRAPGS